MSVLQRWLVTSTIVGCLLIGLIAASFTFHSEGPNAAPIGQDMQPRSQMPAINPAAQATFAYWLRINEAFQPLAKLNSQQASAASQLFGQVAAQLKGIPTLGVDLDAVDCALTLARAFDAMATFLESSNSPAMLLDAFIRGYQGDTLGIYNELSVANRQVGELMRGAANRCDEVRALLTARYGVEFPRL